jgi:hypothetical protein
MGPLSAARALPWGNALLVRSGRGGQQCPAWRNRNTLSIEIGLLHDALAGWAATRPLAAEALSLSN